MDAWTVIRGVVAVLLLLGSSLAAAADRPDSNNALGGSKLASALRQGGFVIYFRHADTGPAYQEQAVDLKRCETQRNLNDAGRAEAVEIGRQFKRLDIPVGEILSSEYCRCRETAELAFGRYTTQSLLTGVSRSADAQAQRSRSTVALRALLAAPPRQSTNTILVSHGFNLWDAEGFHLGTQGEAAIFRPDGAGGHVLVARLRPDEWVLLPSR